MTQQIKTLLIGLIVLTSICSAALIVSFLITTRDLQVDPWVTYEENYEQTSIYGGDMVTDYINLTCTKTDSVAAEIHTELMYEGITLIDTEGINYYYHVTDWNGDLMPVVDTNFDGNPDITIWGQETNNGFTVIRRRTLTDYELVPGTYTYSTAIVPKPHTP